MFINMIEESYKLIYSDRNATQSAPTSYGIENNEEISFFIEQLKTVKAIYNSDPQFPVTDAKFFNVLHPSLVASLKEVNDEFIKKGIKSYNSPQSIDLFPYLIKYYFKFFLSQKDRFKLLSSPLNFKASDSTYDPQKSLQYSEHSVYNKSIQLYEPLDKTRIIDLKRVFVPSPPPKIRIDLSKSSPVSFKQRRDEEFSESTAPSNQGNSSTLKVREKRFSVESPIAPDKICVQIDYQQLARMNNTPTSNIRAGSQHSLTAPPHEDHLLHPEFVAMNMKNRTSLPIPQMNDTSIMDPQHTESKHPESQNTSNIALLRRSVKDLPSMSDLSRDEGKKSARDRNGDDSLPLYNNLHIPRKGSDSNYRLFGKLGSIEDTSKLHSRNSLHQFEEPEIGRSVRSASDTKRSVQKRTEEVVNSNPNPILKLHPANELKTKESEADALDKLRNDGKSVHYGENTLVIGKPKTILEASTPPKSPALSRKRIFDKKEVFISPWESGNNGKGTGIHIEDNLFEKIDMNKKKNFKHI